MADLDRFVIRTFVADDAEASDRVVAMVWERKTRKGASFLDMLPAVKFGQTSEDARDGLAAFLALEIARERRRSEVAAERSERMKARSPKRAALTHTPEA